MKRSEKSAKQLNQARDLEREKKKKEFENEYYEVKKIYEARGFNLRHEFETLDEYLERKLYEWERQQPKIVTGKYQDRLKIVAAYQQKFVEFTRQLCPEVIEELRAFVPYFDNLFGENKDRYNFIFDSHSLDIIYLNNSLDTYINSLKSNSILAFRPENYKNLRNDYKWGNFRLLFQFLYFLVIPKDEFENNSIRQDTIEILQNNLVVKRYSSEIPKDIDESILQNYIVQESQRIIQEFDANRENYFVSGAKQNIGRFLKEISNDGEPKIEAFIALQFKLLMWADRHGLKKDWLLRYAYDFLKQFSNNADLKVSEILVGSPEIRSLAAFPFKFEFEGWLAGDEDKEDFEERLRTSFETELENYFQDVSWQFNLDDKKRVTKPKDLDLVKPLVRKIVQKWSFEKIVENDFGILNIYLTKRKFARKVKYLKEELPKFKDLNLPY
jgi:hypothetical protein